MDYNRVYGFIVVGLIYFLAIVLGVCVYLVLPLAPWLGVLIADVAATAFIFVCSLLFRNASVYDPYWSVQPPVIVTALAIGNGITVAGVVVLVTLYLWAIRLTANWARGFKGLTVQDWRYTMLKEKTKHWYFLVELFGIHLFPTLVVYACTLPVYFLVWTGGSFSGGVLVCCLIALAAVGLEWLADGQMFSFRTTGKGVNVYGLWKYSRHPNYLGEIIFWWAIYFAVLCAIPQYWYLFIGALVNTLMFLFISIPMMEKKQLEKKDYLAYQNRVSMLLLLPQKK